MIRDALRWLLWLPLRWIVRANVEFDLKAYEAAGELPGAPFKEERG